METKMHYTVCDGFHGAPVVGQMNIAAAVAAMIPAAGLMKVAGEVEDGGALQLLVWQNVGEDEEDEKPASVFAQLAACTAPYTV